QTSRWFQNLLLRPDEFAAFCERNVLQTIDHIRAVLASITARDGIRICVTQTVSRLPGLAGAIEKLVQKQHVTHEPEPSSDFGEALLQSEVGTNGMTVLSPEAAARSAHNVAVRFQRKQLARGHFELAIPLPKGDVPPTVEPPKTNLRIVSDDPES